jgi:3-mercaptopyruvate sulfurtransferase SseA
MLRALLVTQRKALLGLIGLLASVTLGVWGCADHPTSYEDPAAGIVTTRTPTGLIEAATLMQWMDEGRVNSTDPGTRDRVVVVEVATTATYAANHIPGAVLLNSSTELMMTRLDGLAPIGNEIPDGPAMDAVIQRCGIDGHTTIVFAVSTGQNYLNATRAYFNFRYWGFPKERLKILQGGDAGWTAAGYELTTEARAVAVSGFSVRDLYTGSLASFGARIAMGQMVDLVDRINAGTLSATAATGVAILDTRGGIVVDVGPYVRNAVLDDYAQYYVSGASSTFKPTDELVARLASLGVTAEKSMTYIYCASGVRASSVYFILDGILGWPATVYDGSSGQWLTYTTANAVSANWRVDANSPGTALSRSVGTPTGTLTGLDPVANATYTTLLDRRANQILIEDQTYFSSGGSSPPPPGGGGGGGGGSGC